MNGLHSVRRFHYDRATRYFKLVAKQQRNAGHRGKLTAMQSDYRTAEMHLQFVKDIDAATGHAQIYNDIEALRLDADARILAQQEILRYFNERVALRR